MRRKQAGILQSTKYSSSGGNLLLYSKNPYIHDVVPTSFDPVGYAYEDLYSGITLQWDGFLANTVVKAEFEVNHSQYGALKLSYEWLQMADQVYVTFFVDDGFGGEGDTVTVGLPVDGRTDYVISNPFDQFTDGTKIQIAIKCTTNGDYAEYNFTKIELINKRV